MAKIINFGKYNKKYNYILLAVFFQLLYNISYTMNYYDAFIELRFFPTPFQKDHDLIHNIFCNFGTFLISIFCYIYERNISQLESEKNNKKIKENSQNAIFQTNYFIYKKTQTKFSLSPFFFLFIITIFVIVEQILNKFSTVIMNIDFWMIELIIISYLYYKLYKIQIYKHQKLALYLNLFPILFKIITIYLSFRGEKSKKDNKNDNGYDQFTNIYVVHWYLLPIGIIIHLFFTTLRSFAIIKIKSFMDFKYISANKLLMFYGFISTLINIIICTIATFSKCKNGNQEKEITDYFCKVKEIRTKNTYYDNFNIYFHTTDDAKDIIFEILVEILAALSYFLYKYFSMMIIKYLSPAHLIFLLPFYYLIRKIIHIIVNFINYIFSSDGNKKIFDFSKMEYLKQKFIFDISGDAFSFILFLIYLEIIEFNFCNLNIDLRRNIIMRSEEDFIGYEDKELEFHPPINEDEEDEASNNRDSI